MAKGEKGRREGVSLGRSLRMKKPHKMRVRRWRSRDRGKFVGEIEEREGRTEEKISSILSRTMK